MQEQCSVLQEWLYFPRPFHPPHSRVVRPCSRDIFKSLDQVRISPSFITPSFPLYVQWHVSSPPIPHLPSLLTSLGSCCCHRLSYSYPIPVGVVKSSCVGAWADLEAMVVMILVRRSSFPVSAPGLEGTPRWIIQGGGTHLLLLILTQPGWNRAEVAQSPPIWVS